MSDYEHSSTWTCEHCGAAEEIENKLDVLSFAFGHDCNPEK